MYKVEHMLKTQIMLITYLRFYPEETAEVAARRAFASDAEDWNSIPSRNIPKSYKTVDYNSTAEHSAADVRVKSL